MLKIFNAGCLCLYLQPFRCSSLFKCVLQPKMQKKLLINPLFWVSRLFEVANFVLIEMGLPISSVQEVLTFRVSLTEAMLLCHYWEG